MPEPPTTPNNRAAWQSSPLNARRLGKANEHTACKTLRPTSELMIANVRRGAPEKRRSNVR
jgi:hypothetical protein